MALRVEAPPEKMLFQLSLRRRGISDLAVLRAMEDIHRDEFVSEVYRPYAWRDTALAIECGQTISQPFVVGYITEQLNIKSNHRVLEIGSGSGYHTAILAKLAREVLSVDRFRLLVARATAQLERLELRNVEVMLGDGLNLAEDINGFDRIVVTAAVPEIPANLIDRLASGGILIAPVGPPFGVQSLVRLEKGEAGVQRKDLMRVRFVPAIPGIAREL